MFSVHVLIASLFVPSLAFGAHVIFMFCLMSQLNFQIHEDRFIEQEYVKVEHAVSGFPTSIINGA